MATGMKFWTGLVVVGLALVAIGQLPPNAFIPTRQLEYSHKELRARSLNSDVRRTHDILKRIRWSEELTAHLAENAVDGLDVQGAGEMTAEVIEGYTEHQREILDDLPVHEPNALVGVYWVERNRAAHPGVPSGIHGTQEYYFGTLDDGRPYCMLVRTAPLPAMRDGQLGYRSARTPDIPFQYNNPLESCRMVAQYEAPGASIEDWLSRGAVVFGKSVRNPDRNYGQLWGTRRGMFGRMYMSGPNQKIEFDQCLAGFKATCLKLMLNPVIFDGLGPQDELAIINGSPLSAFDKRTVFSGSGHLLFSDLEQQFGYEAFDRFWSSHAEVTEAFETAFGMPMVDWAESWVQTYVASLTAGPEVTKSARFGGLFTIMFFGLLAGFWNRRRKVA